MRRCVPWKLGDYDAYSGWDTQKRAIELSMPGLMLLSADAHTAQDALAVDCRSWGLLSRRLTAEAKLERLGHQALAARTFIQWFETDCARSMLNDVSRQSFVFRIRQLFRRPGDRRRGKYPMTVASAAADRLTV